MENSQRKGSAFVSQIGVRVLEIRVALALTFLARFIGDEGYESEQGRSIMPETILILLRSSTPIL
jgi:hypothetical protein